MRAQNDYHRALESKYPHLFFKVMGSHVYEKDGTALPAFIDGQPYNKARTVKVWRVVEKKTDVNLALHMYRDVSKGRVDQVVLVSNDADAEPALEALTEDFASLKIGLIMPLPPPTDAKRGRPMSKGLVRHAHWSRSYIREAELAIALLPECVPTRKKPATKPAHW